MNKYKELRIKASLTQKNVAETLEIDKSSVAKWESGSSKPKADKLKPIAKLYRCTVEELLS